MFTTAATTPSDIACADCREDVLDEQMCPNDRARCTSCCDCHADEA
ncbi:hypothetical protein [Aeromicrobium sp. Leaf291]|nr:hypothetical protein [Aeromicrobium sp. Leaf291]